MTSRPLQTATRGRAVHMRSDGLFWLFEQGLSCEHFYWLLLLMFVRVCGFDFGQVVSSFLHLSLLLLLLLLMLRMTEHR